MPAAGGNINELRSNNSVGAALFNDRRSASKSRESSSSPARNINNNVKQIPSSQSNNSSNLAGTSNLRETYRSTFEHQPRKTSGNSNTSNKSSNVGAAALADESQVEERLRALIAMLGKAPNNHNDTTEGYRKEGERNLHSETNSTKAPNRIGFGLEPLMGGNLANDEEGTLQYLSQLETVARRLKDQLLQDQQKV